MPCTPSTTSSTRPTHSSVRWIACPCPTVQQAEAESSATALSSADRCPARTPPSRAEGPTGRTRRARGRIVRRRTGCRWHSVDCGRSCCSPRSCGCPCRSCSPRSACCSGCRSRSRSSRSSRCSTGCAPRRRPTAHTGRSRPRVARRSPRGPTSAAAAGPRSSRARTRRSSASAGEERRAAETAARDGRQRPHGHERADRHDPSRETGLGAHTDQPAVVASAHRAAYSGVFDVQAAQTGGVPLQPAAAAAELAPGSWSPVPVPVPTYALKAKAEPRYTDDGIPADVFDTPEFADEADELDDRALFARRAVSG